MIHHFQKLLALFSKSQYNFLLDPRQNSYSLSLIQSNQLFQQNILKLLMYRINYYGNMIQGYYLEVNGIIFILNNFLLHLNALLFLEGLLIILFLLTL